MESNTLSSLIQSEKFFKRIFDQSPNAIIVVDLTGTLVLANDRIYDWLEYEMKGIIGKNFLDLPFLTEETKEILKNNFENRMKGLNVSSYKITFHEKSGRQRIGLLSATPIRDENGKIIGDLVFVTDVTT